MAVDTRRHGPYDAIPDLWIIREFSYLTLVFVGQVGIRGPPFLLYVIGFYLCTENWKAVSLSRQTGLAVLVDARHFNLFTRPRNINQIPE